MIGHARGPYRRPLKIRPEWSGSFGAKVRECRIRAKLSPQDIATVVHGTVKNVYDLEVGDRALDSARIPALARRLGVPVPDLMAAYIREYGAVEIRGDLPEVAYRALAQVGDVPDQFWPELAAWIESHQEKVQV